MKKVASAAPTILLDVPYTAIETDTPAGAPDDPIGSSARTLPFSQLLEFDPIGKLTRDIRDAAKMISPSQARFLVDAYYAMQHDRVRAVNQTTALGKANEPNEVVSWLSDQRFSLEKQVGRALDAYSAASPLGEWARSITGIGPVIAAGLLANIDIGKAPTAGSIWRFAGLDPTMKWEKGHTRPWNASLKRLCWLLGESFTKVSNLESDVYGKVYKARKVMETAKNERFEYKDQAAASLAAKKYGADTKARAAYEKGMLPDARIHLRAQRYAVKLFLSAFHEAAFVDRFGELPPLPYILTKPEHTFYVGAPNRRLIPGWIALAALAQEERSRTGNTTAATAAGSEEHVDHILRKDSGG